MALAGLMLPMLAMAEAPMETAAPPAPQSLLSTTPPATAPTPPPAAPPAAAPAATQEPAKAEAAPAPEVEKKEAAPDWRYRLLSDEAFRLRIAKDVKVEGERKGRDYQDNDLRLRFDFTMDDPSEHWSLAWSLALFWNLEGKPKRGGDSPFHEVTDRPHSDAWFSVYTLYADYHSRGILRLARVGRQVSEVGRPLTFDGLALSLAPTPHTFEIVAYGGHLMNFYSNDLPLFGEAGDWVAAGGFILRHSDYLRFDVLYRYTRDESDSLPDRRDHSVSLTARGRWQDYLYAKAYLETRNKDVSETGGSLRGEWNAKELGAEAKVSAQPVDLHGASDWVDPYAATLGRSLAHIKVRAEAWKNFTTRVGLYGLHVGYEARQLLKGRKEESFNRNTGRVYATFSATDIGVKGPFLSATFERLADGPSPKDRGIWSAGGALGYAAPKVRAEIGSVYQLYKYDYFSDLRERSDVETLYAELSGKPLPWLGLRGRYELELLAGSQIHSLLIGLTQSY